MPDYTFYIQDPLIRELVAACKAYESALALSSEVFLAEERLRAAAVAYADRIRTEGR